MNSDFGKAIKSTWIIYSTAGMAVILITLLIPGNRVLQEVPVCYSIRQHGRPCFMCGSTRSFLQFAQGNFKEAFTLNNFAFILYLLIIINSVFFISFLYKLKTKNK